MKYLFLSALSWIFLFLSCKKEVPDTIYTEIPLAHLADYHMELLPEMPSAKDNLKLILYDECKYNKLIAVDRNDDEILIEKQFNSMIMAPCLITNDTILIGQLPAKTYTIKYKLTDIADKSGTKISVAYQFKFTVSKL